MKPEIDAFAPVNCSAEEVVQLTVDEYETIRLIDYLGYTQEQCAKQMGVARTTVQAVYNQARIKVADVLVNGRRLEIRGGNYLLCPHASKCCRNHHCRRNNIKMEEIFDEDCSDV